MEKETLKQLSKILSRYGERVDMTKPIVRRTIMREIDSILPGLSKTQRDLVDVALANHGRGTNLRDKTVRGLVLGDIDRAISR